MPIDLNRFRQRKEAGTVGQPIQPAKKPSNVPTGLTYAEKRRKRVTNRMRVDRAGATWNVRVKFAGAESREARTLANAVNLRLKRRNYFTFEVWRLGEPWRLVLWPGTSTYCWEGLTAGEPFPITATGDWTLLEAMAAIKATIESNANGDADHERGDSAEHGDGASGAAEHVDGGSIEPDHRPVDADH